MDMKALSKTVEKFTLAEPMTLEELHQLMTQRWTAELPGRFKLKKGLLGKSITFDVYMQTQPRVTVKGNLVTVRRISNSTKVSVGGSPGIDFKDMKQRVTVAREGGINKAASVGRITSTASAARCVKP